MIALAHLILIMKYAENRWFFMTATCIAHISGCSLLYTVNAKRQLVQKASKGLSTRGQPPATGVVRHVPGVSTHSTEGYSTATRNPLTSSIGINSEDVQRSVCDTLVSFPTL